LLGEATLTFKKALEISQRIEVISSNAKGIQKANGDAQAGAMHQVKKEAASKTMKTVKHFRHGGTHYANHCKFMDTVTTATKRVI